MEAFETALDRGRAFVAENPAEAQKITGEGLGFDDTVISKAWKRNDFTAKLSPAIVIDFQAKADFLYNGDYVSRHVDVVADKFVVAD